MHTLVVYFSKFGNTQALAATIADALNAAGTVRLLGSEQLTAADLQGADLVVMGTPTHKMNLPIAVKPLFESLPKRILKGVSVAAFDTSYQMSWLLNQFTAAKRLIRKLRRLGGKAIMPPETFLVTGREGPLFEGEMERAQTWANTILKKVARSQTS